MLSCTYYYYTAQMAKLKMKKEKLQRVRRRRRTKYRSGSDTTTNYASAKEICSVLTNDEERRNNLYPLKVPLTFTECSDCYFPRLSAGAGNAKKEEESEESDDEFGPDGWPKERPWWNDPVSESESESDEEMETYVPSMTIETASALDELMSGEEYTVLRHPYREYSNTPR